MRVSIKTIIYICNLILSIEHLPSDWSLNLDYVREQAILSNETYRILINKETTSILVN